MMFYIAIRVPIAVIFFAVFSYIYVMNSDTKVCEMSSNGLLFISNVTKAHTFCLKASKFVRKVLYIKLHKSSESALPLLSKQILNLYSKAPSQYSNLDVRLMLKPSESAKKFKTSQPIDIIFYENDLSKEVDALKKSIVNLNSEAKLQSIDIRDTEELTSEEPVKIYEYVALGGTFDRLHSGHKILLSEAALRSTKHVTVGVTDVNMIQSKKLFELIEPLEIRIKAVLDFLNDVNPELEYNVVPLSDLYGPTKDDPKFQMIVVSEETIRGAVKINEKRKENGMTPMDMFVITLVQDMRQSDEEELKISSSNHRMRMLGTMLKPAIPNPNIPDWPYVVGLAGGIASGKSNIADKLKAKGAAILNCDLIAHDLYKPGLPLNATIAENFGADVITGTGDVDRRKLGQIVFSDKNELEKLNRLVWPAVIEEAQRRIQALGVAGHRVVVMEAAVMIRAKWYKYCHQLWTVIIPPAEAIKRLQQRNNLSEEEARQRIEAQPTNIEQVVLANIVFSPYWSYEYTQGQVDRAWEHLQEYIDNRK